MKSCWNWTGRLNKDGYGVLFVKPTTALAHRVVYESAFGPIPKGLLICHTCDNPQCVNPNHLWVGTNKDNANDKVSKNRQSCKISKQAVEQILKDYSTSEITQNALAALYGLNQSQISRIITNKRRKR